MGKGSQPHILTMLDLSLTMKLPCPWYRKNITHASGMVHILGCRPSQEGQGAVALVEIVGEDEATTRLLSDLREDEGVRGVEITKLGDGRFIALLTSRTCPCRKAGLTNLHVTSFRNLDNDLVLWHVLIPNRSVLRRLVRGLKAQRISFHLGAMTSAPKSQLLTKKQRETLALALRTGFFEFPRKISLTELSKLSGVSAAAVMETLRRAEKKLVSALIEDYVA